MWLGACVSTIGTFVQQFAQSWLVYDLTKDPFYLGLDLFLGQLPIMLFSLVGGVFADRLDRKKMLLSSQYIQMTSAFVLAVLFATHFVKVWHILALSFVVGIGQSFGGPAYSALLPTLVDPEDLANAISMNSIQFNLARLAGPTLGGLAYTAFGATWCFALNGFSFIAVIFSKTTPVRRPASCVNALGAWKFRIATPSRIASSFSQGEAFISANPERTTTFTSAPPRRRAVRQQSIAVFPPPSTATRRPIETT